MSEDKILSKLDPTPYNEMARLVLEEIQHWGKPRTEVKK